MPLSERARIEVYLPDLPKPSYQELLETLDREFTHAFGGSTIIRGLDGSYLSQLGTKLQDRINLIYTDVAVDFDRNFTRISVYADRVKDSVVEALEEEAISDCSSQGLPLRMNFVEVDQRLSSDFVDPFC